jgi:hypothetical protein
MTSVLFSIPTTGVMKTVIQLFSSMFSRQILYTSLPADAKWLYDKLETRPGARSGKSANAYK